METLQVPTHVIEVELRIGRGEPVRGRMFASESPGPHSPTEMLAELLNDEREFVPFDADEPARGRVSLNKRHIIAIRTVDTEDVPSTQVDNKSDPCWVLLSDGEELNGRLDVPTPWSASRLLDKLNQAPRFIPLDTSTGTTLIHGSHVVRVW